MSKVYDIVNNYILDALAKGVAPWRKPWVGGRSPMNSEGRQYNGANYFLLSMVGGSRVWLTANKIKAYGGRIIEGQERKAMPVIFWKFNKVTDASGNESTYPMLRFFNVWNLEQTEGVKLPEATKKLLTAGNPGNESAVNDAAERIVNGMPQRPSIQNIQGSDRACYIPSRDSIEMPSRAQFHDVNEYYSTLFHELGHSTGHASRLNRKELTEATYFGSHDYSAEELVAELTSAFLCGECGIDNTLNNSAAYIGGWLKRLTADPKAFVTAAGKAQKAADYILARNRKDVEESE